MPLRLRSAGGGGVTLKPPVALSTEAAIEVPAYDGAKMLTDKTPGGILQVVYGELSGRVVFNQQSFGDIGLQAVITPKFATSKIYVVCTFGRCTTSQSNNDHGAAFRLLRNGVDSDLNGLAAGNRPRAMFNVPGNSFNADHNNGGYACSGVDFPNTTAAVTYKVQAWNQSASYPLFINASNLDTDAVQMYCSRTKCLITLMEIAG